MKAKVELCMGSSCFARGNRERLTAIEAYIEKTKQSDSILIIGHLCMNNCSGGPVIRVNGIDYLNLTEKEILKRLNEVLES